MSNQLIQQIKDGLNDNYVDAVYEGIGPDAIKDFWEIREEKADEILRLALEDEAELGRVIAQEMLLPYLTECLAIRNKELDLAA